MVQFPLRKFLFSISYFISGFCSLSNMSFPVTIKSIGMAFFSEVTPYRYVPFEKKNYATTVQLLYKVRKLQRRVLLQEMLGLEKNHKMILYLSRLMLFNRTTIFTIRSTTKRRIFSDFQHTNNTISNSQPCGKQN